MSAKKPDIKTRIANAVLALKGETVAVKLGTAVLEDGTEVQFEGDTLEVGAALTTLDESGMPVPVPDADHVLQDGTTVTTVDGVVTEIVPAEVVAEVDASADKAKLDEVMANLSSHKKEADELKAKLAAQAKDLEAFKTSMSANLATLTDLLVELAEAPAAPGVGVELAATKLTALDKAVEIGKQLRKRNQAASK